MSSALSQRILILTALILGGWCLAAFYGLLGSWFTIAIVHSLLAVLALSFQRFLRPHPPLSRPRGVARFWESPLAYAPASLVVMGSIVLAVGTRFFQPGAGAIDAGIDLRALAFILWIPVIEELVFRLGIGGLLRQHLSVFWAAYGSALIFAMAHGTGGWGHLSIPMGPLLLGLACEWLYAVTGRLMAVIALHAACNASGWIFAAIDSRWLDWLQALYLKV